MPQINGGGNVVNEYHIRLALLEKKVQSMYETLKEIQRVLKPQKTSPLEAGNILELPTHLQKTLLAVSELGEATATQISSHTGKARAVESVYANQLFRMGWLLKTQRGRFVIFVNRTKFNVVLEKIKSI